MDNLVIEFMHSLCVRFGTFLTPFMRLISILGEKCWLFLLIAFYLILRKKTRWIGLSALFSILFGFVLGDIILKPIFRRERPYTTSNTLQDYWALAGAYPETDYSMPSGHSLGTAAFFVSLYITSAKRNRKFIKTLGIIVTVLMVMSRCYFMHHYFTDCLVGLLIGTVMAYVTKAIVRVIFNLCKKHEDIGLFNFILNFDIMDIFKRFD